MSLRSRMIKALTKSNGWFDVPSFPTYVEIETTSDCNLRCKSCPRTYSKRPRVNMPIEWVEKILKEISKEQPNLEHLALHCYGEPLMNPQIFDIIKMADEYLPKTSIEFSSNSALLTKINTDKLIDSEIDMVSLWEKEGKENTRGNIKYFLDRVKGSSKINTQIGYLLFKDNGGEELTNFIREYKNYLSYKNIAMRVMETHDFGGYTKGKDNILLTAKPFTLKSPCYMPFFNCIIYSTGEIIPCCMDIDARMSAGNIKDMTIKEAFHSEKFNRLRNQLLDGKVTKEFNCQTCHYYRQPIRKILKVIFSKRSAYNWDITPESIPMILGENNEEGK